MSHSGEDHLPHAREKMPAIAIVRRLRWTCLQLAAASEIERLGDVLRTAWDSQKAIRTKGEDSVEAATNDDMDQPSTIAISRETGTQ